MSLTRAPQNQRGFALIVAIVLIVVGAILASVMAFMVATSGSSAGDNMQSGQALFLTESGVEYGQRSMVLIPEWYRSAVDPLVLTATAQTLGAGTFGVCASIPAASLHNRAKIGDTSITIFTTNVTSVVAPCTAAHYFPPFAATPSPPASCNPCYLAIDDVNAGGEYVTYTGIAGNTFTGVGRGATIGGHLTTEAVRSRSTSVYPVTTLSVALPSSCTAPANVKIVAHPKFLNAGTLDIEGEEISYTDSSTAAGVMTLTGITRCLDDVTGPPGNTPAPHAILAPVSPVLDSGFSTNFEAEINSVGTVGNTNRSERRTIQRP